MTFSLIHAGLAAGVALAALPVILHLFMRQTPKRVVFPALRLIRERQKRSRKRLKIKNWLLLLARMALLALMALALARPRMMTEASVGDQSVPAALGLVFDTSLSMGYKETDKDRLDLAKAQALELLSKTPASSAVFVVDSAEPAPPGSLSPAAARKRIESLTLRAANRALNNAIGRAYDAVTASDKPRHEVYVFTDLARSAWDMKRPADGLEKASKDKSLHTFVLRLTPRDVHDVAVIEARPSADVVTEGEPVEIVAKVKSQGPATTRVVKLKLDGVVRGEQSVELPADSEVPVRFVVPKVDSTIPVHQGEVILAGTPDPLKFDDSRSFTFHVKPAPHILVIADDPRDAFFILNAIDPDPAVLPAGTPRPYRAETVTSAKFAENSENLAKRYRCIFLNNVAELSEAEWGRLSGFVRDGGGLVIGLGRRCAAGNYDMAIAAQILPGTLDRVVSPKEPVTFADVADFNHPLFSRYPKELAAMLAQTPVFRYWAVKPADGARVLMSYSDKSPALIERVFKGSRVGRVMLWTTPLSRRPEKDSPDAWNELPNSLYWSFFELMNETVAYLAGTTEESLNFDAGRDVVLPLDPTRRFKSYLVQDPGKKSSDLQNPPENSDALVVVSPQQLGNWTIKANGSEAEGASLGFSLNPPVSETTFVPLEKADLDRLIGEKKYELADKPSELDPLVARIRIGRELFPWLMLLILIIVSLEGILANRFYRESGANSDAPALARQPA